MIRMHLTREKEMTCMCLTGIMLDLKETCETVLLEDLSSEVASHIAHHTEEYVFLASVVILSEGSQFSSNILTKQIVLITCFSICHFHAVRSDLFHTRCCSGN